MQLLVFQISGAFVNASFRVLLAEMIPVGSELRWYGMQLVLSCSTVSHPPLHRRWMLIKTTGLAQLCRKWTVAERNKPAALPTCHQSSFLGRGFRHRGLPGYHAFVQSR